MAKVRIGIATAFELENELVGIGTDNPTNTLQALGNIKSSDTKAIGITTLTTYQGFTDTKLSLQGSAGAKQHTTSGEIIIEGTVNVSTGTTFTSGPENLTVTDNFTLPGISDDKPTAGTTRFNENLGALEFYTGVEWKAVNSYVDNGTRGRGLIMGGSSPGGNISTVWYINIHSKSDPIDFGELTQARTPRSFSSATRACASGGYVSPTGCNIIDYVTIASSGKAADFGDSTNQRRQHSSLASSTRGIMAGGESPANINVMDYVTIATVGNAADFGDLSGTYRGMGTVASPTRGVWGGAQPTNSVIEYTTIASKGNTTDFGKLICTRSNVGYGSNITRGVFAGGYTGPGRTGSIEYITIAHTGNGIDFGELTVRRDPQPCCSTHTRTVFGNGYSNDVGANSGVYDSIELASGGQAVHFGDSGSGMNCSAQGGCSDSHGGLGGF